MDTTDQFTQNTNQYVDWLQQAQFEISKKIVIKDLRSLGQGRGIIATSDILEDEILFKIPRSVLLNVETSTLSQILPENKLKLLTEFDHWEGLILCLLYEFQLGQQSKWWPYLQLLPEAESFNTLMYWTPKELENLDPSLILNRIGKDKARELYDKLIPNGFRSLGVTNMDADAVSFETFNRIASIIMSYSFDVENVDFNEDEEDDDKVISDGYLKSMCSLADLLNSDTNLNNANLVYDTDHLVMKAIKPIIAGEQVYNIYGDHPNSELLRRYGYIENGGSKFEFGEIPLSLIKEQFLKTFPDCGNNGGEFIDLLLEELIPQNEVEELEENIVLEAYDTYKEGGEVLPESQLLIQSLSTIAQVPNISSSSSMEDQSELSKLVNRILKKCYQLIESNTMTSQAKSLWENCVHARLKQYPSHAFREMDTELDGSCEIDRVRLAECVLKGEVASLQQGLKGFSKGFKIIPDEKLLRNILKKRPSGDDAGKLAKKSRK